MRNFKSSIRVLYSHLKINKKIYLDVLKKWSRNKLPIISLIITRQWKNGKKNKLEEMAIERIENLTKDKYAIIKILPKACAISLKLYAVNI